MVSLACRAKDPSAPYDLWLVVYRGVGRSGVTAPEE